MCKTRKPIRLASLERIKDLLESYQNPKGVTVSSNALSGVSPVALFNRLTGEPVVEISIRRSVCV